MNQIKNSKEARKHWMQLFAVVITMITYFFMTSLAVTDVDVTLICHVMALMATLIISFLIFDSHYITFGERKKLLIVVSFLALFTCANILINTKMIMREGPQELDTLDCITRAIELNLLVIGLFFFILIILHILDK